MKKFISFILTVALVLSLNACSNSQIKLSSDVSVNDASAGVVDINDIPNYPQQEFEIGALSSPEEISEEAYKQYRDAGFNVLVFSIHNGKSSSDDLYYLGSNRTQKSLELCKKMGLDVYIAYGNSWSTREIEGEDYFGETPFSKHNYYSEYMDIIKGVRIVDEPKKDKMIQLADDTLINDFKKIYPDKKYMINLIPVTAVTSRDFTDYDEMLKLYGESIMSKFDNPYISVDVYPFSNSKSPESMIVYNYNEIAKCAKKYNAETTFILQSSTGNEFLDTLSEGDMRFQAYLAIAFGADNLQYYSYSVPDEIPYDYCMLQQDRKTPSELYYYVQEVNREIQSFSSVALAYDWEQAIGIEGTVDQTFRVNAIRYDENLIDVVNFENAKHYVDATATQDLVISQFKSETYGEAYMMVNFARAESDNNIISATFKDCRAVVVYGGENYNGTPKIINLKEDGKLNLELKYGEGVFITPIK